MPVIFSALFGFLGTTVSAIFGFKGEQAKTVQDSLNLLGEINKADTQSQIAAASAIQAILTQGSWIERNWRPMLMIMCITILGAYFFGYSPANIDKPLSPMMDEIFTMIKIGIGGYIPCRTIDKAIQQINIGSILKTLIGKKLV